MDEETLREDLFGVETKRRALATLAPRRLSKLPGENLELLGTLKLKIPTMTRLLFPADLVLPPCLRKTVGLSLTSGLKLTRLLALLDIFELAREFQGKKKEKKWVFLF